MINGQTGASRGKARVPNRRAVTTSARTTCERGRYFTLKQVPEIYPVFTHRLLRRLVDQRRIPFSRVGRCIVLAETDIEAYIEANRVEPPVQSMPWTNFA